MCGIAGFSWPDPTLIRSMTDTLVHRGPDDEGVYVDDLVSLGHRRLSILDLSAAGRQPMCYEHGGRRRPGPSGDDSGLCEMSKRVR
jgi:asparagine synthase (glutamine-hydrolysing)